MTSESFGSQLREMRLAAGLKMIEVATALKVSSVYLSDIERGKRPPFRQREKYVTLAQLLKTDIQTLIAKAIVARNNLSFADEVAEPEREAALALYRKVNDGTLRKEQLDSILNILNEPLAQKGDCQ